MLETLYATTEQGMIEAESVSAFANKFIGKKDEMERSFNKAIYDSRLAGFREGVKVALKLLYEVGV